MAKRGFIKAGELSTKNIILFKIVTFFKLLSSTINFPLILFVVPFAKKSIFPPSKILLFAKVFINFSFIFAAYISILLF
ncbi:hypothetical protein MASR2M54_22450 [Aliarcobacter cryaerophilus]